MEPKYETSKDRYLLFDAKVKKNCTQVDIPLQLDLTEFMSAECRDLFGIPTDGQKKGFLYEFSASVNHAGSAGFGHYWTTVAGPDGNYYKLDDEIVAQVGCQIFLVN